MAIGATRRSLSCRKEDGREAVGCGSRALRARDDHGAFDDATLTPALSQRERGIIEGPRDDARG
jgi:hypothetical protein